MALWCFLMLTGEGFYPFSTMIQLLCAAQAHKMPEIGLEMEYSPVLGKDRGADKAARKKKKKYHTKDHFPYDQRCLKCCSRRWWRMGTIPAQGDVPYQSLLGTIRTGINIPKVIHEC